jgi:hypothetical protein
MTIYNIIEQELGHKLKLIMEKLQKVLLQVMLKKDLMIFIGMNLLIKLITQKAGKQLKQLILQIQKLYMIGTLLGLLNS